MRSTYLPSWSSCGHGDRIGWPLKILSIELLLFWFWSTSKNRLQLDDMVRPDGQQWQYLMQRGPHAEIRVLDVVGLRIDGGWIFLVQVQLSSIRDQKSLSLRIWFTVQICFNFPRSSRTGSTYDDLPKCYDIWSAFWIKFFIFHIFANIKIIQFIL